MYANTRRIQCLNIHAEGIGKVLPIDRATASNGVYTTFIFGIEIPIHKERLFKLNFPLVVIQKVLCYTSTFGLKIQLVISFLLLNQMFLLLLLIVMLFGLDN